MKRVKTIERRDKLHGVYTVSYPQIKKWYGWKTLTEYDSYGSIPVAFYGEKGIEQAKEYLKTYKKYPIVTYCEVE